MAIRYQFTTKQGRDEPVVEDRKMVIPESPDEVLRGDTYEQEQLDWLHSTEKTNIDREVQRRSQLLEAAGQQPLKLVSVDTVKVEADVTPTEGAKQRKSGK